MERVTLRMPKQMVNKLEDMVEEGHYPNRSEAVRDACREKIDEWEERSRRPPWYSHEQP